MAKVTPETRVKRQVVRYLKFMGFYYWHNLQGLGCFKGLSDYMVLHKGVLYAIEVKSEKGKLSAYQKLFKQRVEENGGVFIVARCVDDIIEVLNG